MVNMKEINFENLHTRLIIEQSIDPNPRSDFLHDRDRILFSRSFRRLAGKTQLVTVSGLKTSDHLRSRLTHSLEVLQIGSSIGNHIKRIRGTDDLNIDLIEAISLGHDIGHTPYGHVGEKSLCEFLKVVGFNDEIIEELNHSFPCEKLKHCFQSLKVCCFLEKQYYPDYYGLNLTLCTLDGILKHSKIDEQDRDFYKKCFESYYPIFMEGVDYPINKDAYEIMINLFDYCSPVTLEGVIVSIADEIAQISHDIEDMRRLTSLREVSIFYEVVKDIIQNKLYGKKIGDLDLTPTYDEFLETLIKAKTKADNEMKLERVYTKLILNLSIPLIGNIINYLWNMPEEKRLDCLKRYYTGSFKGLLELSKEISLLDSGIQLALQCLSEIYMKYEEMLYSIKDIARWDYKGKKLCDELLFTLYEALTETKGKPNYNIFERKLRSHLEKSYQSGLIFGKKLGISETEILAQKCLVWDYVAGMTDNYIIKEYESFSFKRVDH